MSTEHIVNARLTELMNESYDSISFAIATMQHSDWRDDTCVFDLSHRTKFIDRALVLYSIMPRDCGACMYFGLAEISKTLNVIFSFYGIDYSDRFGEAFQDLIIRAIEPNMPEITEIIQEEIKNYGSSKGYPF